MTTTTTTNSTTTTTTTTKAKPFASNPVKGATAILFAKDHRSRNKQQPHCTQDTHKQKSKKRNKQPQRQ
jgi:hypothetical protein